MEEEKFKLKKRKKLLTLVITIVIVFGIFVGYYYFRGSNLFTNTVTVAFPYITNVVENTSFACHSLLSADIIGSPNEYITNGIEGKIQIGTDTVAMKIKDSSTLSFLTGAAVEAGTTEGDDFKIIQNDTKQLLAIWFDQSKINSVLINKENGLAVWLKGNTDFFGYGAPHGQVIYMVCR